MDRDVVAALLGSLLERCEAADDGLVSTSAAERAALAAALAYLSRGSPSVTSVERAETEATGADRFDLVGSPETVAVDVTGVEPVVCARTERGLRRLELSPEAVVGIAEDTFTDRLRRAYRRLPEVALARPLTFVLPEGLEVKEEGRLRALALELGGPGSRALSHALAVVAGRFSPETVHRRQLVFVVLADARGIRTVPVLLRRHRGATQLVAHRVRVEGRELPQLLAGAERLAEPPYPVLTSGWLLPGAELLRDPRLVAEPPSEANGLDPRQQARWAAAIGATRAERIEDRGWIRA